MRLMPCSSRNRTNQPGDTLRTRGVPNTSCTRYNPSSRISIETMLTVKPPMRHSLNFHIGVLAQLASARLQDVGPTPHRLRVPLPPDEHSDVSRRPSHVVDDRKPGGIPLTWGSCRRTLSGFRDT